MDHPKHAKRAYLALVFDIQMLAKVSIMFQHLESHKQSMRNARERLIELLVPGNVGVMWGQSNNVLFRHTM
jgi:hypothetical protein